MTGAARIWNAFDALSKRYTARFARQAEGILNSEFLRAADAYATTGTVQAAEGAVRPARWATYLGNVWLTMVPAGGHLIQVWLTKAGEDLLVRAASQWLRENGATRTAGISETSRRVIGNQIRIGIDKGETQDQIAARIRKARRSISPDRAQTIARTEVHAAMNYGSFIAASDSNAVQDKVWLATPDGRARDAHAAASGQRRSLSEPFSVGGEALMYPGDDGSPENTINCRCTLGYVTARRRRMPRPRVAA